MTEDTLLKYEDLITELKQYLGNPKFNLIFKTKTAGINKTRTVSSENGNVAFITTCRSFY